jgi:RNA polymerase sigma-70 factor, ECF subfamily
VEPAAAALEPLAPGGCRRRLARHRAASPLSEAATDAQLLARACEGDDQAFELLVRRYADPLYAYALRVTSSPSDAAEAVQDALFAAWRARASFRGGSTVSTWLYSITRRKALDRIRRRRDGLTLDEEQHGRPADEHEVHGQVDERLDILAALERLSVDHREVVVLADVLSLPLGQIGEITGVPATTVRTRLHRARARLAGLLRADAVAAFTLVATVAAALALAHGQGGSTAPTAGPARISSVRLQATATGLVNGVPAMSAYAAPAGAPSWRELLRGGQLQISRSDGTRRALTIALAPLDERAFIAEPLAPALWFPRTATLEEVAASLAAQVAPGRDRPALRFVLTFGAGPAQRDYLASVSAAR